MNRTRLSLPKMDCAGEERLVRMALESRRPEICRVEADLAAREIVVVHEGAPDGIAALIRPLNFGGDIVETVEASDLDASRSDAL
jgi:copper chaperone CopZ